MLINIFYFFFVYNYIYKHNNNMNSELDTKCREEELKKNNLFRLDHMKFSDRVNHEYPGATKLVCHDIIFGIIIILVLIGAYYYFVFMHNLITDFLLPTTGKVITGTVAAVGAGATAAANTSYMTNQPMTAGYLSLRGQIDDRPGHERMTAANKYMTHTSHFLGNREPPIFNESNPALQQYYAQSSTTGPEMDTSERMTNSGNKYFSDEALMSKAS